MLAVARSAVYRTTCGLPASASATCTKLSDVAGKSKGRGAKVSIAIVSEPEVVFLLITTTDVDALDGS
jgi:hypothetical protein